jgi:hypothetical protein
MKIQCLLYLLKIKYMGIKRQMGLKNSCLTDNVHYISVLYISALASPKIDDTVF